MKSFVGGAVLGLLLLSGCNSRPSVRRSEARYTIDIERAEVRKDGAAFDVTDAVKLEMTDGAIVNQVDKIVVCDDRLVILTKIPQNDVFIFGRDGRFRSKINKGRANYEIQYPTDISVDEKSGRLLILDKYRMVKSYSLEGKFIGSFEFSEPQFYLECIGRERYLFYGMTAFDNPFLAYFGTGDGALRGIYEPRHRYSLALQGYLSKIAPDCSMICPIFSDTIYRFDARAVRPEPWIVFDLHGRSANSESYDDVEEYRKSGRYSGGLACHYVDGKLAFGLYTHDGFYVYDTKTDWLVCYPKLFEELPDLYGRQGQTDREVLFAYETGWLKGHFAEFPPETDCGRRIEAMCADEEDNPIILFATLR